MLSRRSILQGAAAAALGALSRPAAGEEIAPPTFRHRGYLGWITDLASRPETGAAWPSTRLDDGLIEDYRRTFALMQRLGFNEISIWGLFVARTWPVEVESAVTPEREKLITTLLDTAHQHGIRVYSGLGVYSWGFDEIIQAHPELSRGNPHAMCGSHPDAWPWMKRVVDVVLDRFPVDGVSLQSADQGRCSCPECSRFRDLEYHAVLDQRVADYIRSRRPQKIIGVSGWGMDFDDAESLPRLAQLSRAVDYILDVHDTNRKRGPGYRRELIRALACDFGTLGGPQVEPPQHWARDRWFLPTVRRQSEHLVALARDGGTACEYFFHILANPADAVSFAMAGRVLADPAGDWNKHLRRTVEETFDVSKPATVDAIAELLLECEDCYMKYLDPGRCGTISLEPLEGDRPGSPIYLTKALNERQRRAYRADIRRIDKRFRSVGPRGNPAIARVRACLRNVIADAAA